LLKCRAEFTDIRLFLIANMSFAPNLNSLDYFVALSSPVNSNSTCNEHGG